MTQRSDGPEKTGKGTQVLAEPRRARVPLVPVKMPPTCGFSRWGPRVEFESRKRGAIPVFAWITNNVPLDGIAMNVVSMMHVIDSVANPMIGEPALPDLALSANKCTEFMRVCAPDQLNGPLDSHV